MNEAILEDLRAHAGRAVASLPAGRRRKLQMQEEFLAHLLDLYEEEHARCRDEQEAVTAAKNRFGDVEELRADLEGSLPWLEKWVVLVSGKGDRMWRWLLVVVAGCVAVAVGLGFVFPALAYLSGRVPVPEGQSASLGLSVALLVFGLTLAVAGVGAAGLGVVKACRPRNC